jgi:hypothetical protein
VHPMKRFLQIVGSGLYMACLGAMVARASENPFVSVNDVILTELGRGHEENGKIARLKVTPQPRAKRGNRRQSGQERLAEPFKAGGTSLGASIKFQLVSR